MWFLFTAEDLFRLHSPVSGAAFGVEEAEKLLQGVRVGRIPEVRALAPDAHQVLVFQFFEVMGQCAGRYPRLPADFTDDHALRMRAQKEADDAQARFRSHRREHVRVAGQQFRVFPLRHISMIVELRKKSSRPIQKKYTGFFLNLAPARSRSRPGGATMVYPKRAAGADIDL